MKKQFTILRGALRSNARSVTRNLLLARKSHHQEAPGTQRERRVRFRAAATSARSPQELSRSSFELLGLLALAPISQAQTNRPSGASTLEQTESLTALNWQPAPTQANPQTNSTTDPMKFFRVKSE
jgi:hypothetical protein